MAKIEDSTQKYVNSWIKILEKKDININICVVCKKTVPDPRIIQNFIDLGGIISKEKDAGFYHAKCWLLS